PLQGVDRRRRRRHGDVERLGGTVGRTARLVCSGVDDPVGGAGRTVHTPRPEATGLVSKNPSVTSPHRLAARTHKSHRARLHLADAAKPLPPPSRYVAGARRAPP